MFKGAGWYKFLDEAMRIWVDQAFYLLDREEMAGERFSDYGFVVFPMAKAYEGFVKKFLHEMDFIDEKTYKDKYFRIGKSLNPDLPKKYRDNSWVYAKLDKWAKGNGKSKLARDMWQAWRKGRNRVFHYFADDERRLDLREARERIEAFEKVMSIAVEGEKVDRNKQERNNKS